MLEYKLLWNGLPVKYVNPKNSSKVYPDRKPCFQNRLGRLMKCEECSLIMDRDVVAALNIQMRGVGFPQRALNEIIEREGLSGDESNNSLCIPT
ncbi:MAG: zinc ribbon domain-containing protein [Candidatus Bathyarchaeia archaeon]